MAEPVFFDFSTILSPSSEPNKKVVTEVKREMPKRCECVGCNKKLILSDRMCKCKKYFCMSHCFSDNHKCEYDYKSEGINNLKKQLVHVSGHKFEKI
jgi:AN1-type zinc finger and ubiquitin domain-containing protein 1